MGKKERVQLQLQLQLSRQLRLPQVQLGDGEDGQRKGAYARRGGSAVGATEHLDADNSGADKAGCESDGSDAQQMDGREGLARQQNDCGCGDNYCAKAHCE